MITSVRLQNWTSFGPAQTAPLEPITVLVGANNSGKSNFLRALQSFHRAPDKALVHRPAPRPCLVERSVVAQVRDGELRWQLLTTFDRVAGFTERRELLSVDSATVVQSTLLPGSPQRCIVRGHLGSFAPSAWPVAPLVVANGDVAQEDRELVEALVVPLQQARSVHLRADAIRQPNSLVPHATIQPNGEQLAALVARWTLEHPEKFQEFNAIFARCLPEMKRVLTSVGPQQGQVQLVFEQRDGERFDANAVSDGVVLFAGLIAHALEAPENGLVLIEEPERGIHPKRLAELLDILRTLVEKRKTQFVLATHSPALLTLLRDEPESILLFRRAEAGTEIRRLSDVPELQDSLARSDPGELLASGAFDEGYGRAQNAAAE